MGKGMIDADGAALFISGEQAGGGIDEFLRREVSTPVGFEGCGDGISVVPDRGAVEFVGAATVRVDIRLGDGERENAAVEKRDMWNLAFVHRGTCGTGFRVDRGGFGGDGNFG